VREIGAIFVGDCLVMKESIEHGVFDIIIT
jgi:hypothetical protein